MPGAVLNGAEALNSLVLTRPRTALVLSGGASLGALQVGMLGALYEQGVAPDVLVATSVGALNAAFVASRAQTVATARALDAAIHGVRLVVDSPLEADIARYSPTTEVFVVPAPDAARVQPTSFDHSDRLMLGARIAARAALAGRAAEHRLRLA